jgi:hypothetical protein
VSGGKRKRERKKKIVIFQFFYLIVTDIPLFLKIPKSVYFLPLTQWFFYIILKENFLFPKEIFLLKMM